MSRIEVLIVEDERLVARDIQGMLEALGYTVAGIVSTGEDAVRAAAEKKPGIILMDIVLKGAIDGITAVERIRGSLDVPIVFLTAYADETTLERAKRTEPQGYLLKPFEQQELKTAIELALYKHAEERKLKASERWFSSILAHLGDAVIACDTKDRIAFMNSQAESLTGMRCDEALGRPFSRIVRLLKADTGKLLGLSAGTIIRKGTWEAPPCGILLKKGGSEVAVEIRASLITGEKGTFSHVVFVLSQATGRVQKERALAYAAIRDELTGLPNRVLFEDRIELAISQASRKNGKLAVVLIELGGLQEILEQQGRDAADRLRKQIADRMAGSVRAGDTAARIGNNEFGLLLQDVSDKEALPEIIGRVLASLKKGRPSLTVGTAFFPGDAGSPREFIEKAESSLAQARAEARPKTFISPPARATKRMGGRGL